MTSYLELSWFNKRVTELVQIMTAIPASVISLYLVNNSLGQMTGKVALLNELGLFGNSESNLKPQPTVRPQFKF